MLVVAFKQQISTLEPPHTAEQTFSCSACMIQLGAILLSLSRPVFSIYYETVQRVEIPFFRVNHHIREFPIGLQRNLDAQQSTSDHSIPAHPPTIQRHWDSLKD